MLLLYCIVLYAMFDNIIKSIKLVNTMHGYTLYTSCRLEGGGGGGGGGNQWRIQDL